MAHALKMPPPAKGPRTKRANAGTTGARSLGVLAASTIQLVQQAEKGFPYTAIIRFHNASGLPMGNIASLVRIPQRTLMRRKARGRLQPEESERLLRVSGVFEKAVELFEGDG